jgi:serine/threonine protein kinase
MLYLHGKNIIHCDLKSSNLLMDENYKVKISDFGLSQIKRPGNNPKKQRSTRLGTPQWMAPEVMKGIKVLIRL